MFTPEGRDRSKPTGSSAHSGVLRDQLSCLKKKNFMGLNIPVQTRSRKGSPMPGCATSIPILFQKALKMKNVSSFGFQFYELGSQS